MKQGNRPILPHFFIALFILLLMPACLLAQTEEQQPNVLLLNSYHKGFLWTDEITRGVEETLSPTNAVLHVEYMDTKRHFSEDYLMLLSQLLSLKHRKYRYKAILISDNNAFNFIKQRGKSIFGNTPIIFCGLNYLQTKDLEGMTHITGINEQADIKANIELIRAFHPNNRQIVVITDDTTTGKRIQEEVQRIKEEDPSANASLVVLYDLTRAELQKQLNNLAPGSVVLFTLFFRDSDGIFLEYDEGISLVTKATQLPIYVTWKFSLQQGVIGGYLTAGYDQGAKAAEKAREILAGKPAREIPINWQSPTRLYLDYEELQQNGIDSALIPKRAELLNPPVSFFEHYKSLFIRIAMFIAFLILAIAGLAYGLLRSQRAENTLRRAENFISNIINSMPSALVGVDSDGTVTHWNAMASETTNVSSKQAVGQHLSRAFPRLATELEQVKQAMGTRQVIQETRQTRNEDEETCFEDITIYPLVSNGVNGAVIRLDDVTEKIRLEEMMIQSEKMLSIGGLAAGMAHEINNPLAGMIQTANVMKDRLTNTELPANIRAAEALGIPMPAIEQYMAERGIPKMLSRICESGNRAADIVTNMLQFARKSSSTVSSHNLGDLLDQCIDLAASDYDLRKRYDFRKISIVREYQKNLPPLPCDKNKLQQVILNILRNGAEAMQNAREQPTDPHTIILRIYQSKENSIRIEIEDNGPGMEESVRKRVFEPFFTTKDIDSGTGLGLSVSYFIITESLRGKLEVRSSPGMGAIFIIELPLDEKNGKPPPYQQE